MTERPKGLRLAGLVAVASLTLAACTTSGGFIEGQQTVVVTGATLQTPPLDEIKGDLALGKEHYRNGSFGLAEKHFRLAVEKDPPNPEAWLGLAAAYDKLGRWDLADRAYRRAYVLVGPTPELLNNRGYSYMLRGKYRRAGIDLAEAAAKAPDDERIRTNLDHLRLRTGG
jgi:Flp pilus assembly protein TadD